MRKALYREWRPSRWDQVIGQEHIIHTLKNAIQSSRTAHAYLFAGPRGTGKTTTARLLAKAVNCLNEDPAERPCDECDTCKQINKGQYLDLIEIDAASNTSVDDVRELRDKINFSPTSGKYKVYIIDEVHMLSTAAFNALLKTLEEPPPHAIFVLATTEIHKIPATVLSRCQRYEFRRIPVPEMVKYLQSKCVEEKINVEPDALTLIARQATGSMRDAISLLDQLASTGDNVTLDYAQQVLGTATNQAVVDIVETILQHQAATGLNIIQNALDAGTDPRQFARQVVDYLRNLLMVKMGKTDQPEISSEVRQKMQQQSDALPLVQILETIRFFNEAATETRLSWQPGLQLDLALAGSINWNVKEQSVGQPSSPSEPVEKVQHGVTKPAVSVQEKPVSPAQTQTPPPQETKKQVLPSEPAKREPQSQVSAAKDASSNTGLSLKDVQNQWKQVKELVRKVRPATEGLLNSCQLMSIKGNVLVLAFSNDVIKSKMETKENLALTRSVLNQIFERDLEISCVLNNRATGAPIDMDIEENGIVRAALNLGGVVKKKE
ncbi:MAG: DNA polymerase III subunit gamma/tau [Anaerolineaceae bacterium]